MESTDLFNAYKEWAKVSNEYDKMSLTKFSTEIDKHSTDKASGDKKYYKEKSTICIMWEYAKEK